MRVDILCEGCVICLVKRGINTKTINWCGLLIVFVPFLMETCRVGDSCWIDSDGGSFM